MNPMIGGVIGGVILCFIQFAAALPWLAAADQKAFWSTVRKPASWLLAALGIGLAGAGLGLFFSAVQDQTRLLNWGRPFGAILHAQLNIDAFILTFVLVLACWPKGGSVALAAFREGIRQPMFWLLTIAGMVAMIVSPFIPYFSFGDDYKFVQQIGYETIWLLSAVFAVLNASMSISEEIEGRTAVTLMSKPISRRQFLLGKFLGIFLATLVMTSILGLCFDIVLWFKPFYDNEPLPDPPWLALARTNSIYFSETASNFAFGALEWIELAVASLPGLILGSCQVMVLLAIAVALATRLPMVVNLVVCLLAFYLGNLNPVLVQVSQARFALVAFIARFLDTALPSMEFFNLGAAIAKEVQPPTGAFYIYLASVVFYALVYTTIALLFGLILFEDRDLA